MNYTICCKTLSENQKQLFIFFFIFIGHFSLLHAQRVTVSPEITLRNSQSYDIIPIQDNILLYSNKINEHSFDIYDQNLYFIQNITPQFEEKVIVPICILPMDTVIRFYYSTTIGSNVHIRVKTFDKRLNLSDTVTIVTKDRRSFTGNVNFVHSFDGSKTAIFYPSEKNFILLVVDNQTNKLISSPNIAIPDINFRTDFKKIVVTNDGEVYVSISHRSFWDKRYSEGFKIIHIDINGYPKVTKFSPDLGEVNNPFLSFDEMNKKLLLAGFFLDDNGNQLGYFGNAYSDQQLQEDIELKAVKFENQFITEVTGKKGKKISFLSNFYIKDILPRYDGGLIIISESVKEFMRSSGNMRGFGQYESMRGNMDYYFDDIIIFGVFPDGSEHWRKVLFKKQFSQDDSGIYSSYLLFSTPSRLRLIYNDEIKSNNTVSEYIIDPLGNVERRSVLSTEYQNLKLRFRDGIQTGPSSYIVPSEKSWKISLVKIEYN